jgi:hypothetical protein
MWTHELIWLLLLLSYFVISNSDVSKGQREQHTEEGCTIAHYKQKSDEEMAARQKSYQAGAFMRDKLNATSEIERSRDANAIVNIDMLRFVDPVRQSMKTPLKQQIHPPGFFALVCIFDARIEASYMEEWLYFYLLQGVDQFYLYANGATTTSEYAFLNPFLDSGVVTLIPWPNSKLLAVPPAMRSERFVGPGVPTNISIQNLALQDYRRQYSNRTIWVLSCDIDEYARPHHGKSLREMLKLIGSRPRGRPQIQCPRIEFGSSGHKTRPSGLIMESYTKCADKPRYGADYKSITRAARIAPNDRGGAHSFSLLPENHHQKPQNGRERREGNNGTTTRDS